MSKELHIALQEAISDLGTDVLKSPFLVNILQDYGAFDVHDKESVLKKEIISALIADNYFNTLLRWKKKRNRHWQNDHAKYIERFTKRHHFDSILVNSITDTFIQASGLLSVGVPKKKDEKGLCKFVTKYLIGPKIILQKEDKVAIFVGIIIETIVLSLSMFYLGYSSDSLDNDGFVMITIAVLLFGHLFSIGIRNGKLKNDWDISFPRESITLAFVIGEFVTVLFLILAACSDLSINFFLWYFGLSVIIMYALARFLKVAYHRLFWYTSMFLSLLLLILFIPPAVAKHNILQGGLYLYAIHQRQMKPLGYMGVQLDESYQTIKEVIKYDTNIVGNVLSKEQDDSVSIDWLDIDTYRILSYIQEKNEYNVKYGKELHYAAKFFGDTVDVAVLFINDTARIIVIDESDVSLYREKYGQEEVFYFVPPEEYIEKTEFYPYYRRMDIYGSIRQWSFANGTIRIKENVTTYITKDILDAVERLALDEQLRDSVAQKVLQDSIRLQSERLKRLQVKEEEMRIEKELKEKEEERSAREKALRQI